MTEPEVSTLLTALRARPRKVHEFPVSGLLGFGNETLHKVAIRVPTHAETVAALDQAHRWVAKQCDKNPRALDDPEIVQDAKAAAIVAMACRDPARPEKMPIWPTAEVLSEQCTPDQIASLLALVNYVRRVDGPSPQDLSAELVDSVVTMCAGVDQDIAAAFLARFGREELCQLIIQLCLRVAAPKAEPEPVAE